MTEPESAPEIVTEAATATPPVPPRPFVDFGAAIGFLTLLPCGRNWPDERPPRAVGWYGWVGWLLAAVALLPLTLAQTYLGTPDVPRSLLFGALVVAVWGLLTRFLHWDGLADTFDGVWGGSTPERRLEIMRDSHIGSFGIAAIVITALVQVASATSLISRGALWPFLVAPVVGRFSASLAAWELPPARRDGLGLSAVGRPILYDRLITGASALGLMVCISLGATSNHFVLVTGAGVIAGMAFPRILSKKVGGITGDIFGATILLVETVVLLVAAAIL